MYMIVVMKYSILKNLYYNKSNNNNKNTSNVE